MRDVYQEVTDKICAALESGVAPWHKPWSASAPEDASYIASWLKALRNDKRCIFTASAMAQRAADYLAGFSQVEPLADAAE